MMNLAADWQDRSKLINYLAQQLAQGRLALFLGAGISKFCGLPDWNTLVDRLLTLTQLDKPELDVKRTVEFIRLKHFQQDETGFREAVRAALYQTASSDFEKIRANKTLAAIGALVMSSRRGGVAQVVNFNFDNLLGLYLKYHGFTISEIFEEVHWSSNRDVKIYHPHGFLPMSGEIPNNSRLVLDQTSFNKIISQADGPWRQILQNIIRTNTIIFIGLSGNDDNIDSLLDAVKERHATKMAHTLYMGVRFSMDDDEPMRSIMEARDISTFRVTSFDEDLPNFLFEICQSAASKHY
ncbi:SIR2 family protein [Nitrospirillum sp. BR 11164]|uniref:SIR2 family protein n=1 Tax=Nitrospirillum sp. BR 11164 TaxID=3104324 RepID=UPI002AFDD2EE|nr:SIR2 family protein [Nitrospirillum sp. BR 11164]MEA1647833.1 SIR2 family protein [Nitrospirillum sp. BR 11164]